MECFRAGKGPESDLRMILGPKNTWQIRAMIVWKQWTSRLLGPAWQQVMAFWWGQVVELTGDLLGTGGEQRGQGRRGLKAGALGVLAGLVLVSWAGSEPWPGKGPVMWASVLILVSSSRNGDEMKHHVYPLHTEPGRHWCISTQGPWQRQGNHVSKLGSIW